MIILHGENILLSRQQFINYKSQAFTAGLQVMDLPGISVTLSDLVTAVESVSLFGSTNAVFIEGLFSRRVSNEKKSLLDYLKQHIPSPIYLWDDKDISSQIKSFPPSVSIKYDLPKYVFKYLESFSLSDLNLALVNTAPEQILSLVSRHLCQIFMVKDGVVANLAAWQLSRLKNQAAKYPPVMLRQMAEDLLQIDFFQKTSTSPLDLNSQLQIWTIKANQNSIN